MFLRSSDFGDDSSPSDRAGEAGLGGDRGAGGASRGRASSGASYGRPPATPTRGAYGRHSYGAGAPSPGRPATMGPSYGRHMGKDPEPDRPASAGGLGTAGALPSTETRKSMLERQRELQRKRRAARAGGGFMATSRNISGPDGPRSPMTNPQRTRGIPQYSAPRAYASPDRQSGGAPTFDDGKDARRASAASSVAMDSSRPGTAGSSSGMTLQDVIREREARKRSSTGSSYTARGSMTAVEKDLAAKGLSATYDPPTKSAAPQARSTRAESKVAERIPKSVAPDLSNMKAFLTTPTPKECGVVQCYIHRYKSGLNKLYPLYHLFMKNGDKFLLAAKKRAKQRTSNYLISKNKDDMSRTSEHFIGKLRSNFVGTEFTAYDRGANPKDVDQASAKAGTVAVREELALVTYAKNVMGTKGPRKMRVCVPKVGDDGGRMLHKPLSSKEEGMMAAALKANDLSKMVYMINKPPQWNESVGAYVLNFNGRVTMASVKNFQLVDPDDMDTVILQFGRVGKDVFTMDYQWPMCPLQAFSIALSSFDYKIACE